MNLPLDKNVHLEVAHTYTFMKTGETASVGRILTKNEENWTHSRISTSQPESATVPVAESIATWIIESVNE